jgi:hypothetical protein
MTSAAEIKSEKQALEEYLSILKGATIIEICAVADDDFGFTHYWPVFWIKTKDGKELQIEVSCDPEGNGPGHLFMSPAVREVA